MKNTNQQPLKQKWTAQLITVGKFIWLKALIGVSFFQNKIPIVTETEYPLTDESNMCKVEPQGAKGVLVKSHQCYR